MKSILIFLILGFSSLDLQNAFAQSSNYPSLSGRVVDQVGVLTPAQEGQIVAILEQHE